MNFLQWFKENGSINQSMPELENDEVPNAKSITSDPYSVIDRSSILNKKLMIKAKENAEPRVMKKIMLHPGYWIILKIDHKFLKAKNFNDGYEVIFPINSIEIH